MERLIYILIIFILGIAYLGASIERAEQEGYEQGYQDALAEEEIYTCEIWT